MNGIESQLEAQMPPDVRGHITERRIAFKRLQRLTRTYEGDTSMAQVKKHEHDGSFTLVTVKVGDSVGFKCDLEQGGQIIDINGDMLTLENKNGFSGEYLRFATTTQEPADRCWID